MRVSLSDDTLHSIGKRDRFSPLRTASKPAPTTTCPSPCIWTPVKQILRDREGRRPRIDKDRERSHLKEQRKPQISIRSCETLLFERAVDSDYLVQLRAAAVRVFQSQHLLGQTLDGLFSSVHGVHPLLNSSSSLSSYAQRLMSESSFHGRLNVPLPWSTFSPAIGRSVDQRPTIFPSPVPPSYRPVFPGILRPFTMSQTPFSTPEEEGTW